MINLLIGPPGGGKSYEAVVYHILPALEAGRKVITNLPLNLEHIAAVNSAFLPLIDIRQTTRKVKPVIDWQKSETTFKKYGLVQKQTYFINAPFAHSDDYGDSWRHPVTGSGPLYVIDECHIPLPSQGTSMEVEHWYSLHRHESADVLLLTQSYGKINRSIRDLVQVCYRVKKNTSFGSQTSYVRKVQDGVRGEVVNTGIRKYEKQYFPFYQSHTRGGGSELAANDIVPIWRRWPILGAGFMFIIFFGMLFSGMVKNPMNAKNYKNQVQAKPIESSAIPVVPVNLSVQTEVKAPLSVPPEVQNIIKPKTSEPYAANGVHIVGRIHNEKKSLWILALSINGQKLKNIKADDLNAVGYKFEPVNDCGAWIIYNEAKRFITCDTPRQTATSTTSVIKS